MAKSRKICDPLYDYICDPLYDYISLDPDQAKLVNHEFFQRLRSIQQLGFSEQAFPSGTNNRFCHSLGTFHLAGLAFDSIFNKHAESLNDSTKKTFRKTLQIAALLHDVGHGPLSHSSESLMPDLQKLNLQNVLHTKQKTPLTRHEDYSLKFIIEQDSLKDLIDNCGVSPDAVAQILHKDFKTSEQFFTYNDIDFLPLFKQIISSDFDIDRMDYLYRDSLYCGVQYGRVDFNWIIMHFNYHIVNKQAFLAIEQTSLYTLESFILAREHMRMVVYFHRKPVIYNEMLKKYAKESNFRLPANIKDYAEFTDFKLIEQLQKEEETNPWAKRIIKKQAYLKLYERIIYNEPINLKQKEKEQDKQEQETFDKIKNKLEKENIDIIVADSNKHSIKPDKNPLQKDPIYLKKYDIKTSVIKLNEDSSFLKFPSRNIQRIYVEPRFYDKAQKLIECFLSS